MPRAIRPASLDREKLDIETARLRGLNISELRARWHTVFRRAAPPHLPRHLLFRGFGSKTEEEKQEALAEIEARAHSAGLKGHAVAVWDAGGGQMAFHAPTPWHPYFKSINLQTVFANVNRELSW